METNYVEMCIDYVALEHGNYSSGAKKELAAMQARIETLEAELAALNRNRETCEQCGRYVIAAQPNHRAVA